MNIYLVGLINLWKWIKQVKSQSISLFRNRR